MARPKLAAIVCGITAALSLLTGLLPVLRGGEANAVFLGGAVVFFAVAIAAFRREPPASPPGLSNREDR